MTNAQIRIGLALLAAQIILLALTMGFHQNMDARAERAGIAGIIQEAGR